jgi:hypothetical protein
MAHHQHHPQPPTESLPQTITNGEASGAAPPNLRTTNLVPLFPDPTSDPSASDAAAGTDSDSTTSRVVSPVTSPPYWQLNNINSNGSALRPHNSHNRTASAESILPPGAITLQDNEDVSSEAGNGDVYGRDRNRACWAKSVEIVNHVVVNGSATNIGAFVVWNIRVETLSVSLPTHTHTHTQPLSGGKRRKRAKKREMGQLLTWESRARS